MVCVCSTWKGGGGGRRKQYCRIPVRLGVLVGFTRGVFHHTHTHTLRENVSGRIQWFTVALLSGGLALSWSDKGWKLKMSTGGGCGGEKEGMFPQAVSRVGEGRVMGTDTGLVTWLAPNGGGGGWGGGGDAHWTEQCSLGVVLAEGRLCQTWLPLLLPPNTNLLPRLSIEYGCARPLFALLFATHCLQLIWNTTNMEQNQRPYKIFFGTMVCTDWTLIHLLTVFLLFRMFWGSFQFWQLSRQIWDVASEFFYSFWKQQFEVIIQKYCWTIMLIMSEDGLTWANLFVVTGKLLKEETRLKDNDY